MLGMISKILRTSRGARTNKKKVMIRVNSDTVATWRALVKSCCPRLSCSIWTEGSRLSPSPISVSFSTLFVASLTCSTFPDSSRISHSMCCRLWGAR